MNYRKLQPKGEIRFWSSLRVVLMTFSLAVLFVMSAKSQGVENVKATVKDDLVVVTYDLIGKPDQKFDVELFYSKDNFSGSLNMVTGDVGKAVSAGLGKRIEWLAKTEMGEYTGNLIFEVKAFLPEPVFPPLQFKYFTLTEIKNGKSYRLQWEGGNPDKTVELLLYEDGAQKSRIAVTENSGQYLWKIPSAKKGASYKVHIKGDKSTASSTAFEITKPFPVLLVGGGSALVVGGIAAAVILMNGGGAGVNDLPTPPDPND